MVIRDRYVKEIFESFGFEFSDHRDGDSWVCEEISKSTELGHSNRNSFKYQEYEIIISDVNHKEGRYYYQRFNMGLLEMDGYTNSYRNAIRLTFEGIRKVVEIIGKYKYISGKSID